MLATYPSQLATSCNLSEYDVKIIFSITYFEHSVLFSAFNLKISYKRYYSDVVVLFFEIIPAQTLLIQFNVKTSESEQATVTF